MAGMMTNMVMNYLTAGYQQYMGERASSDIEHLMAEENTNSATGFTQTENEVSHVNGSS